MDMAVRSFQPYAMQQSSGLTRSAGAGNSGSQIQPQHDTVQLSSDSGEGGGVKESSRSFVGESVKMAAGVLGGAAGLVLAPFGGIALGAYSGVTGRTHYSVGPIEEPGLTGATVHKKILNSTGSKALAVAGGVAAGVPGGLIHALVLFPILGFVTSYERAGSLIGKMFGS